MQMRPWPRARPLHEAAAKATSAADEAVAEGVSMADEAAAKGASMADKSVAVAKGVSTACLLRHFFLTNPSASSLCCNRAPCATGTQSKNLLWRLMNGEMPYGFDPRVWWVGIGLNDLSLKGCSEEVVLLGILRVVEEIQT